MEIVVADARDVLTAGGPSATLVMCPSHITPREVLLTIPRARAFLVEDMCKLGYFWDHAYLKAKSGPNLGSIVNPDSGLAILDSERQKLTHLDFDDKVKMSETLASPTGRPFSVLINNDSALDGESNQRAALVPGANPLLPSSRHRLAKAAEYFNRDAFTYPKVGTFSPIGRNAFVGPGYIMTNMTIGRRDFPLQQLREGMRLNFRVEGFNVFNTPNLGQPQATFSCSTTSTNGNSCPQQEAPIL
jgi:hypothetical protein